MPLLEQRSVNELARRRHARRFCVITAKYIPWDPIGAMPDDRKDGRLMLLWEGDRPVIGRWDDGRQGWEEPEGKIGSASWRERGCQYVAISVVAGSVKKKNNNQNTN